MFFVSTDPLVYSSADIKVKLKNRGNDPYKGDIYGDSICIEHRISSDGCRTCKIKNKMGNSMTSVYRSYQKQGFLFVHTYIEICSIFRACHFHKEGGVNCYTGPFWHPGTFCAKISSHIVQGFFFKKKISCSFTYF